MLNENKGCNCGDATENIRSGFNISSKKLENDPLVGKKVILTDGRVGLVDDSIRNGLGEVIGYVIEGEKGSYRVFKNRIYKILDENEEFIDESDVMASLDSTPGMGDIYPPTRDSLGSGDQFPTLIFRNSSNKKNKKKKKESNPIDTSVIDFKTFLKRIKKSQLNK